MKGIATAVIAAVAAVLSMSGCANPDAPVAARATQDTPANIGEPAAPPPRPPSSEDAAAAQPTAQRAIERFAWLDSNWSYRSLPAVQHTLAAIAVGAARLQAQQWAASARDQQLAGAHVWNRGRILSVNADRGRASWWLVVTEEQTGGTGEYASLPAGYHLTLARVVPVSGGWAVSEWQPQS